MLALFFLLALMLDERSLLFTAQLFKASVIAFPEGQFTLVEMQNIVTNGVQHVAIMADDENGRRIFLQVIDEPERAFQIKIIGRLIEQEKVWLCEQNRSQGNAHTPTAGKFG